MGKRRKEESPSLSTDQTDATFERSKKRRRKEENAEQQEVSPELTALPTDEYDVWLIKKPKSVKLENLAKLKFPRMGKMKSTIVECSNDENAQLHCDFMPVGDQMFHVPTSAIRTREDAMNVKAVAEVTGLCLISKMKTDNALGLLEMSDGNPDTAKGLEIHSIRKVPLPVLRDETTKERLKAFGVKPKKKRTLPNLT